MTRKHVTLAVISIAAILGLYALAEWSGYGLRSLMQGKSSGRQPLLTCSMAFAHEGESHKTLTAAHNPDIVIRNPGPFKALSVAWKARVYRYDALKQAITAFAIQDPRKLGQTDFQKEIPPSDELRHATMGLPGDHIVAVYFVRVDYRIEAKQAPTQIENVFFVTDGTIYDGSQFRSDPRYAAIMQAIRSFDGPSTTPPAQGEQIDQRTDAVQQPPLSIQVYGVYRPGGTGPLLPITDGTAMNSGDHYKIYFRANRDCYAYIYQVDALDNIFQLFPLHQFDGVVLKQANPVIAGVNYMLPSRNRYFYLDDTIGEETLYFAVSLDRNKVLEDKARALHKALDSHDSHRISQAASGLTTHLQRSQDNRQVEMIISPVSWKSSLPTAPVLGYHVSNIGEAGIHSIDFIHR